MPSLEDLKSLCDSCPDDPFPVYGYAIELKKRGRADDALVAFGELLEKFPGYIPGHQHRAMTLAAVGRVEDARAAFRHGIKVAKQAGDHHAASEMEAGLDAL